MLNTMSEVFEEIQKKHGKNIQEIKIKLVDFKDGSKIDEIFSKIDTSKIDEMVSKIDTSKIEEIFSKINSNKKDNVMETADDGTIDDGAIEINEPEDELGGYDEHELGDLQDFDEDESGRFDFVSREIAAKSINNKILELVQHVLVTDNLYYNIDEFNEAFDNLPKKKRKYLKGQAEILKWLVSETDLTINARGYNVLSYIIKTY